MPSSSIKHNWTLTWNSRNRRRQMIIGTVIVAAMLYSLPFFFAFIQKRKGVVLNDWLLARIPPHDVSAFIFGLIGAMGLLILIRAVKDPSIYITYCWTMIFVYIVRFVTLSLVALDPPIGLVPLIDPISNYFSGSTVITKDLFFSGHTATMVQIYLCLNKPTDKIVALIAAVAVACLLLVQHIHYTVDVLVAPMVVYPCYLLTRYLFFRKTL